MKIVFRSEEFAELNFERNYPEGYEVSEKSGIREALYEWNYLGLHSSIRRISCPGVMVSLIEGSFDQSLVQILESDFPYLQMHFELTTAGCLFIPKAKHDVVTDIPGGHHSLLFYPALKGDLHYLKKENAFSVEIELSLDFIRRIFNHDLEILGEFGKSIERDLPALWGRRSYPITSAMTRVLFEIRDCSYSGVLKKAFIEAKVIELLTLQISQIQSVSEGRSGLKKSDIDRLHQVRELLLQNLYDPYSIEELSRLAGINRTKLQAGFKELFGSTIFNYISDARLEEARRNILEGEYRSIAEIATYTGYKNPQHFTAAFKKKFGYLPREIRRQ